MRIILLLSSLFLISSCCGGYWGHQGNRGGHGYHGGHGNQASHCPACHASAQPAPATNYVAKAPQVADCDICRNSQQSSYGYGYGHRHGW